jgi:hypothetical protein
LVLDVPVSPLDQHFLNGPETVETLFVGTVHSMVQSCAASDVLFVEVLGPGQEVVNSFF